MIGLGLRSCQAALNPPALEHGPTDVLSRERFARLALCLPRELR